MVVREAQMSDLATSVLTKSAPHEVLAALGEPTRMEMVWRLATRGPMSLGRLTSRLPMSRQGATKHVKVLLEAGILKATTKGRRTEIELQTQSLGEMTDWLGGLATEWNRRRLGASLLEVSGANGRRRSRLS